MDMIEVDMQERKWLREEISELQTCLKAIILSNGGMLKASDRDIAIASYYSLDIYKTPYDRTTEFTVKPKD
jgi:hypothetical protein